MRYRFKEKGHDVDNAISMYSFKWYVDLFIYLYFLSILYSYIIINLAYVEYNYNVYHFSLLSAASFVGLWRIGEKIWHYFRATIFKTKTFKKVSEEVDFSVFGKALFVIVTSWKKTRTVNIAVFSELMNSALSLKMNVNIVFMLSKGDLGKQEEAYLKEHYDKFFRKRNINNLVTVEYKQQNGLGKRFALFTAIMFILKKYTYSYTKDCVFAFMDGDTLVPQGLFEKVIPYVFHNNIGGVTVGNKAYTEGGQYFRDWMDIRFFRRDIDCCSILSVLTGRLYFVRGIIITLAYAWTLLVDIIKYPFKGSISSLTGDDKTVVKSVIKAGYEIFYVHNVYIYVMEEPIEPQNNMWYHFFKIPIFNNILNMVRYKKNKFRHGADFIRQLKGITSKAFTYKIRSQFLSSFTPILGLYTICILTYIYGEIYLAVAILYLLVSRGIETFSYGKANGYWAPRFVYIHIFEIYKESFIDIFAMLTVDKQRWPNSFTNFEYGVLVFLSYTTIIIMVFILALLMIF